MNSQPSATRGLATVALLKARYDAGLDYLDMFLPFVTDALFSLERDDFGLAEIRDAVQAQHGLSIPIDTMQSLVARATKRGYLKKEGGRYFRISEARGAPKIQRERREVGREIKAVGAALFRYIRDAGEQVENDEESLAWLFAFLSENQVQVLLEDDPDQLELRTGMLDLRQTRLVARFVQDALERDPPMAAYLENIFVGFVLQNALLLKDVGSVRSTFPHLEVYFDSGFLFGLLGYKGSARQLANIELLELLRAAKAHCRAFEPSVREMIRILGVYETLLTTPQGRESLHPTDLTRHFLTRGATASDIRQEISLLRRRLADNGVQITDIPNRVPDYTLDEPDLADRLKRGYERGDEPRILHDVDCVAAVLVIRRGAIPQSLDESRAVFVTTSGLVVKTVVEWYTANGGRGMPPIIHQHTLSNLAWLKRPASGSKLKVHELVALCAAALRPSRQTWQEFLRHLRELHRNGAVSSDEAVAIVVSGMTDIALAEAEEDDDLSPNTLTDVVERVKATYREDALVLVAEADAARIASETMQRRMAETIEGRIRRIALAVSRVAYWATGTIVLLGLIVSIPNLLGQSPLWLRLGATIISAGVVVLTFANLVTGVHLEGLRMRLEKRINSALTKAFMPERDKSNDNSPGT